MFMLMCLFFEQCCRDPIELLFTDQQQQSGKIPGWWNGGRAFPWMRCCKPEKPRRGREEHYKERGEQAALPAAALNDSPTPKSLEVAGHFILGPGTVSGREHQNKSWSSMVQIWIFAFCVTWVENV